PPLTHLAQVSPAIDSDRAANSGWLTPAGHEWDANGDIPSYGLDAFPLLGRPDLQPRRIPIAACAVPRPRSGSLPAAHRPAALTATIVPAAVYPATEDLPLVARTPAPAPKE